MKNLLTLFAGVTFGFGLIISGMSNPNKVINFLDITGNWDPSLALVMLGAIPLAFLGFRWIETSHKTIFNEALHLPGKDNFNPSLLLGSLLFGVGWAITGFCPGRTWNLQTKHLDPDRVKLENKQAEKPKAWKDQKPQPAFSLQDEGFSQMILASEPRAFPANVSIEDASLGEVYSSGTCHTNSAGTPSFEHDPASRVDRILWEWDRGCALPRELCDPFKDDFSIPALTEQML